MGAQKTWNGLRHKRIFQALKIRDFKVITSSATSATFRSLALIFKNKITMHEGRHHNTTYERESGFNFVFVCWIVDSEFISVGSACLFFQI